jgi:hypothetical protein
VTRNEHSLEPLYKWKSADYTLLERRTAHGLKFYKKINYENEGIIEEPLSPLFLLIPPKLLYTPNISSILENLSLYPLEFPSIPDVLDSGGLGTHLVSLPWRCNLAGSIPILDHKHIFPMLPCPLSVVAAGGPRFPPIYPYHSGRRGSSSSICRRLCP